MTDEEKKAIDAKENEVFNQELSLDDLDATAGGGGEPGCGNPSHDLWGGDKDADRYNCANHDRRQIYGGGGFPNCAATVEDGSWCKRNDACYDTAVDYKGMTSCKKAWR